MLLPPAVCGMWCSFLFEGALVCNGVLKNKVLLSWFWGVICLGTFGLARASGGVVVVFGGSVVLVSCYRLG